MEEEMKLLLAGTYLQARNYMLENHLSMKDARFVAHRDQVMGLDNCEAIRIGTWAERSDMHEIENILRTRRGITWTSISSSA
jgi:hypothetical protein